MRHWCPGPPIQPSIQHSEGGHLHCQSHNERGARVAKTHVITKLVSSQKAPGTTDVLDCSGLRDPLLKRKRFLLVAQGRFCTAASRPRLLQRKRRHLKRIKYQGDHARETHFGKAMPAR